MTLIHGGWMKFYMLLMIIILPLVANGLSLNSSFYFNETVALKSKKNFGTECRMYHAISNSSKWCSFVSTNPNCAMDEGFVNYLKFAFCDFDAKYLAAVSVLYAFWLLFLFVGLGTTAEGYFCTSLQFIAKNLKMSHNIAGLTIVAFGNGAPDIFSAIAAFTSSNPTTAGVAIGALLGAALLVTTVVAGLVATTQTFDVAKRPFLRDLIFFMATVFWLFTLIYQQQITLLNSVGFLILYASYVAVALIGRYINQKQRAKHAAATQTEEEDNSSINNAPPSVEADEHSPLLSSTFQPHSHNPNNNHNENNLDSDGEWMDVNLTKHPPSTRLPLDASAEVAVEADEDVTSTVEEKSVDDFSDKSTFIIFFTGLNPITTAEWERANLFIKILVVLQIPWNIVCKLTIPLVIEEEPLRAWNRPLHCLCLIVAPVFCVFATKGGNVYLAGVFPLWGLLLTVGIVLSATVWFTSSNLECPKYQWVLAYVGFVVAIIWTYITANEIVNLIQTFGVIINVNNVIMGLTFLAWGNSIADVVADVTLAKQGFPRMSLSACFGGPLFNILIGVGLSCTINAIKTGHPTAVGFSLLEPVLCGAVLFVLCFSFLMVPLALKFQLTPWYGWVLIALYLVLLAICILVGLKVF